MKLLKVLIGALLVLLLLGAGAAFLLLDTIVKAAIEKGATYATGVETKVGSADAGLFAGRFELHELSLANPPGFREEPFVRLGDVRASWENGSLLSDTLEMDAFIVENVDVNLERSGSGTNYGKILANLEKLSSEQPKPETPKEKGRVLAIKKIEIRNVKAGLHLTSGPVPGSMSVTVPSIVIHDFRSDGSTKTIVAKLTRALIQGILDEVLKAGGGIFPDDILKDLGKHLGGLEDVVGDGAKDVIKGLEGVLKDAGGIFKKK